MNKPISFCDICGAIRPTRRLRKTGKRMDACAECSFLYYARNKDYKMRAKKGSGVNGNKPHSPITMGIDVNPMI